MEELLSVRVSKRLVERLTATAAFGNRPVEDVAGEYLGQLADERPCESMTDSEVLARVEYMMPQAESDQLGELQADQREGRLTVEGRQRLDQLMRLYYDGLLQKAQGYAEAVRRGLLPRGPYG